MRTETLTINLEETCSIISPGASSAAVTHIFSSYRIWIRQQRRKNLIWNCQLSKAFLKKKQLLLRFKFYDILRQEISMVRTISATAIRDADYKVLGRYFMVHAILRLNMNGEKVKNAKCGNFNRVNLL